MSVSALAVPYSKIPRKDVHWLHEGFVPFRHVTLVVAARGTCKGLWTLDYAARLTRGDPMPGEQEPGYDGPMDVIVILPEDDPNESVAGRLEGARAAVDRVHNLTVFADGSPFTLQHDIPVIEQAIHEVEGMELPADGKPRKVGMVILDPLLALSENDLRTRGQARGIIEQLEHVARKHHLAMFLTHHTNADGKAASSRAIVETVRHEVTLSRLPKAPDDSPVRVMTVTKSNIGEMGISERFAIAGTRDAPCIAWASEMPAEDESRGYDIVSGSSEPELSEPESSEPESSEPEPAPVPQFSGIVPAQHDYGLTLGKHAKQLTPDMITEIPLLERYRASYMVSTGSNDRKPLVIGDYPTRQLARIACEKMAGSPLGWQEVPVPGMEGAAVSNKKANTVTRYSVLDRIIRASSQAAL